MEQSEVSDAIYSLIKTIKGSQITHADGADAPLHVCITISFDDAALEALYAIARAMRSMR